MAPRVTVVHHPEGYAAIYKRVVATGEAVTRAVRSDAVKLAPKATGELASTILYVRVNALKWHILVGTDHWMHQEYGTLGRNPIIEPRTKQALWWQGLPHPIARVTKHPGNKAQPFMRPATYQRRTLVSVSGTIMAV